MRVTHILVETRIVEIDRVRPRAVVPNVVGPHVEAAGEDALVHGRAIAVKDAVGEVPPSLPRTVPQRAGPGTGAGLDGAHVHLAAAVEGVADEGPVDEVRRRVDGGAGEELERRGREEVRRRRRVCRGHDADRRVRVEARDDRVRERGGAL